MIKKINYIKKIKLFLPLVFFFFNAIGYSQFDIPKKPSFQTSVYDYADILNETEEELLKQKLIRYSDTTSSQIVIITIEDLKGEDIGILTPKWGHEWGIGQEKEDNGIIILLAKNDRKIWISPGYGLEHKLTAGINGELIRTVILPEFKKGNYYLGLDKGTSAIFEVIKGTYKGTRKSNENNTGPMIVFFIFFIILLIIIFKNKNNRNNGGSGGFGGGRGPDLLDVIILSNLGRSGGGFGSGSSGGGFGSGGFGGGFGGGGFSGGGAGGDW